MKIAIVISGTAVGLGVIRSLGSLGVPIVSVSYDEKDIADVSKYVIKNIDAPHPEKDEEKFVATLIDISSDYNRGILIPASDDALVVVARHKNTLENHYIVACTEWEITEQFIKKELTYKLANTIGVSIPRTLTTTYFIFLGFILLSLIITSLEFFYCHVYLFLLLFLQ